MRTPGRRAGLACWLLLMVAATSARPLLADDAVAERLGEPGAVLLIRHALAPGIGDPDGFRLDDCATQRNLSAEGRAQSRALGELLATRDVAAGPVLSSRWCRCVDTARLAFGRVEHIRTSVAQALAPFLEGKQVRKVIYVKHKLVNIVA